MNILFVIHTPKNPLTAVYANIRLQADYLAEQGHRTTVLAPSDFSILSRRSVRWVLLLFPWLVAIWLMRRNRQCDVVVFHSYSGWVFNLFRGLPGFKRIRTITSFHGLEPLAYIRSKIQRELIGEPFTLRYRLMHGGLAPWLIRMSCRRSNLVTCLNDCEAAFLREHRWAEDSKIVRFDNFVDDGFFLERTHRDEVRRLLFVGQWGEMKGIRYLAEAFTLVAREVSVLELWCAGTSATEEEVQSAFPEDVRARVIVRSNLNRDEMKAVFAEADIFVFPTLSEGSSHALLEAMASGLPIITTMTGAAPDMLESEIDVLFVPERNTDALVVALRRLLDDATLRRRLGDEAQGRARDFMSSRVRHQYLRLIDGAAIDDCVSNETIDVNVEYERRAHRAPLDR